MKANLLVLGGLFIASSAVMAAYSSHYWYFPLTIGVWLLFAYLAKSRNRPVSVDLLNRHGFSKFILIFISLSACGIIIEAIGYLFGWWHYPNLPLLVFLISVPLMYPFILLSFAETLSWTLSFRVPKLLSVAVATTLSLAIWEIPNAFFVGPEWIYSMPATFFIIGWLGLILVPYAVIQPLLRSRLNADCAK